MSCTEVPARFFSAYSFNEDPLLMSPMFDALRAITGVAEGESFSLVQTATVLPATRFLMRSREVLKKVQWTGKLLLECSSAI